MEFINDKIFWVIFAVTLFVLEIFIPGFVLFFLGVGAAITFLTTLLGVTEGLNSQILTFILSSLISLMFLRKYMIKFFSGKKDNIKLDESDYKGKKGICVEKIIPNDASGKVEINGTNWSANSEVVINKGALVEVLHRKDLRLYVKPAGS